MNSLLDLIDQYQEAIEYDLIVLGLRLAWLGTHRLSWHDLKVILHQSPASSALHRALYPPKDDDLWTTSLEPQLLALVVDGLNVNNYLLQRLGGNDKATYPEPLPRPGVTPNPGTEHIKGTPRPIEEMNQLLGWDNSSNNN